MSGKQVATIGISGLLRLEAERGKEAFENLLWARHRTDRLRAIRVLAVVIVLFVGFAWAVGELIAAGSVRFEPSRGGPIAAQFFSLILLVDGLRQARDRSRWDRRFAETWLVAVGVGPVVLALRGVTAVVLRTSLLAWVPLVPLMDRLRQVPAIQIALLLAIGVSWGLLGDAAGQVWRFGPLAARIALTVSILSWWIGLVFGFLASQGLPVEAPGFALTVLWTWALTPWIGIAVALGGLTLAIAVDSMAQHWAFSRVRWVSEHARSRRWMRVKHTHDVRPAGRWVTLLRRDRQRLFAWVVDEPIAAVILLGYSFAPFLVAPLLDPSRVDRLFGAASGPWVALFALGLPALAIGEIVWGRESRSVWAWYRMALLRPSLAVWSHAITGALVLASWHLSSTLLMGLTTGLTSTWGTYLTLGLLMTGAVTALGAAGGSAALRWGDAGNVFGRLLRYSSVAIALLVPVTAQAVTQRTWLTALAATMLGGIGLAICSTQVRSSQFERVVV